MRHRKWLQSVVFLSSFVVVECESSQIVAKVSRKCRTWFIMHIGDMGSHHHNGSYHARTKHIDIQYHFIQFVINNETINLIYCPTNDMVTDTLTKALPNIKAKHFAFALGLQST